jgi:PKD repeat protein/cytolysin (calcineurin-like family phosphatase)
MMRHRPLVVAWVGLVALPLLVAGPAGGDDGFSMIILSDPQYQWWRHGNDPDCKDTECVEAKAFLTNTELILAANDVMSLGAWPTTSNFTRGAGSAISDVKGVIINGDLTAYFHPAQASWFQSTYPALLKYPMYPGLGNHDYENNVDNCSFATSLPILTTYEPDKDRCAKQAVWYMARWIQGNHSKLVDWHWPGMVAVHNQGGYVARVTLSYVFNGLAVLRQTGSFAVDQWGGLPVPVGASDAFVLVENHTGFEWKTIATYPVEPRAGQCWAVGGTTYSPSIAETACPGAWPTGSGGSLAYSFDVGDYHFVQLHNYPGYKVELQASAVVMAGLPGLYGANLSPGVTIVDSYPWLKRDVQAATAAGKSIVINMHHFEASGWDANGLSDFSEAIEGARVVAIFAGHVHEDFGQVSTLWSNHNGTPYQIPWFRSGSAECGTFLLADFREGYFNVSVVRSDSGRPRFVDDAGEVCDEREYSIWDYDTSDPSAAPPDYRSNDVVKTQGSYKPLNTAPMVTAAASGPIEEGRPVQFKAVATDDGEWLDLAWSFGDHESRTGRNLTSLSHTYADSGTYTVRVVATDDEGASRAHEFSVTVANVAPRLRVEPAPAAVDEGGTLSLDIAIEDPGSDGFTLEVEWGQDGTESLTLEPSKRFLSLSHVWADDDPSGTSSDLAAVTVRLWDDDGARDSASVDVTIRNLDPMPQIVAIRDAGGRDVDRAVVGQPVTAETRVVDPGPDTLIAMLSWGDETSAARAAVPDASVTHVYQRPGTFTVMLLAADDDQGQGSATRVVTVVAEPSPVADAFTVDEDRPLTLAAPGVLANDVDLDGDALRAVLVSGPTRGTLSLAADGSFTYLPPADFAGTDGFSYRVDDGTFLSDPVPVTITVAPVNDPPVAVPLAVSTAEGEPVAITLRGQDVEGDFLTFKVTLQPAHGTVQGTLPSLTYVPAPGFNGSDRFAYLASDGLATSEPATVAIEVTGDPDGQMRGQGVVEASGVHYTFGFEAFDARMGEAGRATLTRRGPAEAGGGRRGDRFLAQTITAVRFSEDGCEVLMSGEGSWNGVPGHAFRLRAVDNCQPGVGDDLFEMSVSRGSDVVASIAGAVRAGYIQGRWDTRWRHPHAGRAGHRRGAWIGRGSGRSLPR